MFQFFAYGHIHNIDSTLVNVKNLDIENKNVENIANINLEIDIVDSTLLNVENFSRDVHNIV